MSRARGIRTPSGDLQRELKDPEFVAYFTEAQMESAKELLKYGVINKLTISGSASKTVKTNWGVKDVKDKG